MRTLHIEQVLLPVLPNLLKLHWLDNQRCLAVFQNPQAARSAMQSVDHPFFKMRPFSAVPASVRDEINPNDIPRPQRPATDSSAAKRLIANALNLRRQAPRRSPEELQQIREREKKEREERRAARTAGPPSATVVAKERAKNDTSAW